MLLPLRSDTGEHVSDAQGQLQYIPFPTCNETGAPLALHYGLERDTNCTIPFITDEFFHLLEFYVHSDAPLSCRIPARPLTTTTDHTIGPSSATSRSDDYIPMSMSAPFQLCRIHPHSLCLYLSVCRLTDRLSAV